MKKWIFLFLIVSGQVNLLVGQCGTTPSIAPPQVTSNGITLTEVSKTGSAQVQNLSGGFPDLAASIPAGSNVFFFSYNREINWPPQLTNFTYTLSFSQPVNDLVFAAVAMGYRNVSVPESVTFVTTGGTSSGNPVITFAGSHQDLIISGNTVTGGLTFTEFNAGSGYFKVRNNAGPFTTLTMSGPGFSEANGFYLALCSSNFPIITCDDASIVFKKMAESGCPNNILADIKIINGADILPAATPITFYDGNPTVSGAIKLTTYVGTPTLAANAIISLVGIDVGACDLTSGYLYAIIGDDGTNTLPLNLSTTLNNAGYLECNYTNNLDGQKLKARCAKFGAVTKK